MLYNHKTPVYTLPTKHLLPVCMYKELIIRLNVFYLYVYAGSSLWPSSDLEVINFTILGVFLKFKYGGFGLFYTFKLYDHIDAWNLILQGPWIFRFRKDLMHIRTMHLFFS